MIEKTFVSTSFSKPSGHGTPMLSRPGRASIAQYLCFKEESTYAIPEGPEYANMTEEDKRK